MPGSKNEYDDDFTEHTLSLDGLGSSSDDISSMSEDAIDAEIRSLLDAENAAGLAAKEGKGESEAEQVKDATVADTEGTASDDDASGKKKIFSPFVFLRRFSVRTLTIIAAVLAVLIICVAAAALIVIGGGKQAGQSEQAEIPAMTEAPIVLDLPEGTANNSAYIYVNDSNIVGGKKLTLTKIVSDGLKTVFRFDGTIDYDGYTLSLEDNRGKRYVFDSDFSVTASDFELRKMLVAFSPLEWGVKHFSFDITENATGNTVRYAYNLSEPLKYGAARYALQSGTLGSEDYGFSMALTGASFSQSGSYADFFFYPDADSNGLVFLEGAPQIKLTESYGGVIPLTKSPIVYSSGDGGYMCRTFFSPLKNLYGNVYFSCDSVFSRYDLNEDVRAAKILYKYSSDTVTVTKGRYSVVLEGFARQGDLYVLVLHTEDNAYDGLIVNGTENRVENRISAEIEIPLQDGTVITVQGKTLSKQAGSDVIFDVAQFKDRLENVDNRNINIKLSYSAIKREPLVCKIDLSECAVAPSPGLRQISAFIQKSFGERLAFKAGGISASDVTGNAEASDMWDILSKYRPVINFLDYEASVTILSLLDSGESFSAVVAENLQGSDSSTAYIYARIHVINGRKTEKGYEIYKDEIKR